MSTRLLDAVARFGEAICHGRGWPDGVNAFLAELGQALAVSRAWIFQTVKIDEHAITQDYIFEWASESRFSQRGQPAFSLFTNSLDHAEYRPIVEERNRGQVRSIITSELPPSWLKDFFESQDIRSCLTLPIVLRGAWWGTLGFDHCEHAHVWTEGEVAILRTASCLVSNAIDRDQLSARLKQFRILQDITESATWAVDLKKGRFWCSGGLVQGPDCSMPYGEHMHLKLRGAMRMVHPEDRAAFKDTLRAFFKSDAEFFRHDLRMRDGHGRFLWVELLARLDRDESGRAEQLAGIAIDIRRRKEREQRLRDQALTDPLTGTANRWTFEERLRELVQKLKAGGDTFSMLLFDLDHFKAVNDSLGHPTGDAALVAVTRFCAESLRDKDVLARIGGEEFAVLLPGVELPTAKTIGNRIRQRIAQSSLVEQHPGLRVTISVGCATCDPHRASAKILCSDADAALYEAKRRGRNQLVGFDELEQMGPLPVEPNIAPSSLSTRPNTH